MAKGFQNKARPPQQCLGPSLSGCVGVWAHRFPTNNCLGHSVVPAAKCPDSQHKKYHGKQMCLLLHCISFFCIDSAQIKNRHWFHTRNSTCRWHDIFRAYLQLSYNRAKKEGKKKIINSRSINGIGSLWATPFWGVTSVIRVWVHSTEVSSAWANPGRAEQQWSRVCSTSPCSPPTLPLPLVTWILCYFLK